VDTEVLNQSWHVDAVDDDELAIVIAKHFQLGVNRGDQNVVYIASNGEDACKLVFVNGSLSRVEAGPGLDANTASSIQADIESLLLQSKGSQVFRSVIFTMNPIEGAWRYGDSFALLPAPANAPRPDAAYGEHPAILELKVPSSGDFLIDQYRHQKALFETRHLLSALVHGGLAWNPTNTSHIWVLTGQWPDKPSSWSQIGYLLPGLVLQQDAFTETKGLPRIALTNPDAYYARRGFHIQALDLPGDIEVLLDLFFALSKENKNRFLRACFWKHLSREVWYKAQTLTYVCLASAVESLLKTDAPPSPCPTCRKDRSPGPTAQFKAFIERYAPASVSVKERGELYRLRSKLSHGEDILRGDLPKGFATMHPTDIEERDKAERLHYALSASLVNWLRDPN
jgi:hypothetical protein